MGLPPLLTEAAQPLNSEMATAQYSADESLEAFIECPYSGDERYLYRNASDFSPALMALGQYRHQ
jgi:hypothetical protein